MVLTVIVRQVVVVLVEYHGHEFLEVCNEKTKGHGNLSNSIFDGGR